PKPASTIRPGVNYTMKAPDSGGLVIGAPILYKQIAVGEVTNITLAPKGDAVFIRLNMQHPYNELITKKTVFWNAGGLKVDASLSHLQVNLGSVQSLLAGGVAFAQLLGERRHQLGIPQAADGFDQIGKVGFDGAVFAGVAQPPPQHLVNPRRPGLCPERGRQRGPQNSPCDQAQHQLASCFHVRLYMPAARYSAFTTGAGMPVCLPSSSCLLPTEQALRKYLLIMPPLLTVSPMSPEKNFNATSIVRPYILPRLSTFSLLAVVSLTLAAASSCGLAAINFLISLL
ncbi:MCE family protein, partial [bacterium]|nr:MCE family protein [bacterium]